VAAIQYLINNGSLRGVFNLTAPEPVTNREFFKTLAATLKRPCWLPVPSMLLKLVLGEMADELFLSSQRVLPKKLLNSGFGFKYPGLEGALKAILTDRRKK
jgi:NAD dependent epimerase/dehydratase family enzyme